MSNVIRSESSALNIYYNYYGKKRPLDAKTYCEKLCDAIVEEYRRQGFCKLVDDLLESRQGVEVIAYVSFQDAARVLNGYSIRRYNEYVPERISEIMLSWRVTQKTWKAWQSCVEGKMPTNYRFEEAVYALLNLKKIGQNRHLSEINDKQKNENQAAEKQGEAIVSEARKQADLILDNANAESKRIIDGAKAEAERVRTDAKAEAERIRSDVKAEAERIRSDVKTEAERIKSDANAESERISSDAKRDGSLLKRDTESEDVSRGTIRAYLSKERAAIRESLEKEFSDVLNENKLSLGKSEELHNAMCDQSNALQASWVKALNTAVEELTKIKEDFYTHIRSWQVSLYPHELRPLAERYVELYQIVNIDRLIAEELFQLNSEENGNKAEQNEKKVQPTSPILEGLEKLNRKLTTFLHKFEVSLNGLDMYVFFPKQGDRFDEVWHVLEDDTYFDYNRGYKIAACVVPGVAKKINDSGEDDVIIPAIVSV